MVILDPKKVRREMRKCDDCGEDEYLRLSGFDPPKRYWVVDPNNREAGSYPAKAIVGKASGLKFDEFNGGEASANLWLKVAGFEIEDRKGKRSDPKSASTRNQRTSAAKIVSDYRKRLQKIGKTEVERLGKARIGQDIFRKALLKEWEGCPLTKITDERLLRASHIKPWSQCASDLERLDPDNGLLLSSLWDAAFDAGLVTFSDDGKAMDSSKLGAQAKIALQFDAATPLELTSGRKAKLKWHRSNRFQK